MAKATIFSLAHKGGTGRSMASVNLAYQLSTMGNNVALVDMDLVGGTLHHVCRNLTQENVPRIDDLKARAEALEHELTVSQYLLGDTAEDSQISDLYSENLYDRDRGTLSSVVGRRSIRTLGRFTLFPRNPGQQSDKGNMDIGRVQGFRDYILTTRDFDFLIVDMQAGKSSSLMGMLEALKEEASSTYTHWCVYARATPQHVAGAQELLSKIRTVVSEKSRQQKVWLIPTAVMSVGYIETSDADKRLRSLMRRNSDQLSTELNSLKGEFGLHTTDLALEYAPALHCAEGVVTETSVAERYYHNIRKLAKDIAKSSD